jgi:amino acid transporter
MSTTPADDRTTAGNGSAADNLSTAPGTAVPPTSAETGRHEAPVVEGNLPTVRQEVVARQKEQFGGIKIGSAFFGWLTATGTVVLLSAAAATIAVLLGYSADTTTNQFADPTAWDVGTTAWVGGVIALVILFVSYYCGGYVAGRMARFSGAVQGLAVWLWAVLAVIVVTIVGLVAGNELDLAGSLDGVPQIGAQADDFTLGGVVAALLAAAVTLGGAIVGGLAGMRFHRRVDKAGLGK